MDFTKESVPVPALVSGWMLKRSRNSQVVSNWRKRYFVLSRGIIKYYKDAINPPRPPFGVNPKGQMNLSGGEVLHEVPFPLSVYIYIHTHVLIVNFAFST